jgi:WD40 repeat protein
VAIGRDSGAVQVFLLPNLEAVTSASVDGIVRALAFHPSAQTLAVGTSTGNVVFLRTSDGAAGRTALGGVHEQVTTVVYLDNTRLVTGGLEGHLNLWHLDREDIPIRLPLQCQPPGSIDEVSCNVIDTAINADRTLLAVSSGSDSFQLWDVSPDGLVALEQPVIVHSKAVNAVDFGLGGQVLATTSADGTAVRLELEFTRLIDLACDLAGRNFTASEWAAVGGDDPYVLHCALFLPDPSASTEGEPAKY